MLSGIERMLQFDGEVKHFLPQTFLSLYLFLVVVMVWWTIWWFRDVSWQFSTYLYMILQPVLMYVACALAFPNRFDGDQVDMESHYYKVRVPILTVSLIAAILVYVDGVAMGIEPVWHSRRYIQIVTVGLYLWALIDSRKVAQYFFSLGALISLFALMIVWFWAPAA